VKQVSMGGRRQEPLSVRVGSQQSDSDGGRCGSSFFFLRGLFTQVDGGVGFRILENFHIAFFLFFSGG